MAALQRKRWVGVGLIDLENLAVFSQVHGSLGSVVVLLLWVYFSAVILILGAQVCYQYELLYRPGTAREGVEEVGVAEK